jgi:hypothetical protein
LGWVQKFGGQAEARAAAERCNRGEMSARWLWEQGTEALTLLIEPASCPVCGKGLYRNITFLTGGWARCARCSEVVHYSCLSGGKIFKRRPRICQDCKAGRVRAGQKMPASPPKAPDTTNAPAPSGSAKTDPFPVDPAKTGSVPISSARPEPAKPGSSPADAALSRDSKPAETGTVSPGTADSESAPVSAPSP